MGIVLLWALSNTPAGFGHPRLKQPLGFVYWKGKESRDLGDRVLPGRLVEIAVPRGRLGEMGATLEIAGLIADCD